MPDHTTTTTGEAPAIQTVRGTVVYVLSSQGQRAALLAGRPAEREQHVEADIPADLLPRCEIAADGTVTLATWPRCGYSGFSTDKLRRRLEYGPGYCPLDVPPDDPIAAWRAAEQAVREAIEAERVEVEARQASDRARAERWAALPLDWRISPEHQVAYCRPPTSPEDYHGPLTTSGAHAYSASALERYVPEAWAEAKAEAARRRDAEVAETVRAERAAREAKAAAIADWVREHGTDSQRQRLAAGLLPEAEVIEAIAEAVFGAIPATRFREITLDECLEAYEYPPAPPADGEPLCGSSDAETATARQWEALTAIRAALPEGATATLRRHVCGLSKDDDPHDVVRYGVLCKAHVGPIRLVREFAAPGLED